MPRTTPTLPPRVRVEKIPNMKHVTYYLLVSISFPYIHTRQIGHDESPQLLVVGELEQDTWALEGQARHSPITLGPQWQQSHPILQGS